MHGIALLKHAGSKLFWLDGRSKPWCQKAGMTQWIARMIAMPVR
jgi:hypothetical protein